MTKKTLAAIQNQLNPIVSTVSDDTVVSMPTTNLMARLVPGDGEVDHVVLGRIGECGLRINKAEWAAFCSLVAATDIYMKLDKE